MQLAPDGAVAAAHLHAKKGTPLEVWFLDANTLAGRGRLLGRADPDRRWDHGGFTPDSRKNVVLDEAGDALLWDVAGQKVERTLPFVGFHPTWKLAFSPDGKTVAFGWSPRTEANLKPAWDPDPEDLPQPRVTLLDLAGGAPPRTLVAPHGQVGDLAFSPDGKTLALGGSGAVHLFALGK